MFVRTTAPIAARLPAASMMICFSEQYLPVLDPQDQPLIIEIYGYMPERQMCVELRRNPEAYAQVEQYFEQRGIRWQCCYVEYFVSVIFQLEDDLQYEIHLSQI